MPRMTYDERNNRAINTCNIVAKIAMNQFMYRLSRSGESVLITEGYRGKDKQDKEYDEGNSQVIYPFSFHNHGVAIDLVPVLFGQTRIIYNAKKRYERIAKIANQCGFDWGYNLWGFDKPHFHYTQGNGIGYFISDKELDKKIICDQASAYYNSELQKIDNGIRHSKGSRKRKLEEEHALVVNLMTDCEY